MFWSIAVSLSIIRGEWDNLTPRQKRTLSAAVFIAILTCWALLYCRPLGGVSSNTVIKAIDATKGTWLAVDGIVLFQNFLASTAIVLLVVSLCILVFPLKNEEINRLSSRIHRFALSIYSTAALLAAGIFEIYTLFMWAAARPEFHGNVNQIRSLANTLTVAAGVFFSTLMLVIYTPVAIV